MWSIVEDLRVAVRTVRCSPGFAAVAALTLGLGIAANTTVFGWINAVLLNPVPGVTNAHELTALEAVAPNGSRLVSCPHPDFRDFQRSMASASGVVGTHLAFFNIGSGDHPRRVLGQVVSANFFAVLGVKPFLGRMLLPQEDRDDRGAHPVAVISHRLWRTHFGANPRVVGRSARMNGHTYTIVGVAPPEFRGTVGGAALDLWVPLSMVIETGSLNTWAAEDRNARFLDVIIRLKPGATIEQARAEAGTVAARIAAAYPDTHKGVGATLVPMWQAHYGLQSPLRGPLRILMFVCVLALLIACANVANLLMARCISRRREFAIRMALGAGRGRIVRQLMAESLLLGGAGAAVGVLLAQWFGDALYYALPALDSTVRMAVQPLLQTAPDRTVLAFAVLVSVGAAVLAAVIPAITVHSVGVNENLKEGRRSGTQGMRSRRGRTALVVTEVALASMALIGAGLAVRSFHRLSGA
ncbi:MAG TPA: ABC transporter permease, partial [Bryobacteraceae bacterium]|nr:ABC transporter permease [Bryobacteraceae bacterium]